MFRRIPPLWLPLSAAALVACSSYWDDAAMLSVDGYMVRLKSDPVPQVGDDSLIRVKLTREDGQPATGCRVSLRQSMPEMEMATDRSLIVLAETSRRGVYEGLSRSYSMGGEWLLQVEFSCSEDRHSADFSFRLAWPE